MAHGAGTLLCVVNLVPRENQSNLCSTTICSSTAYFPSLPLRTRAITFRYATVVGRLPRVACFVTHRLLASALWWLLSHHQKSFFNDYVSLQLGLLTGDKSARCVSVLRPLQEQVSGCSRVVVFLFCLCCCGCCCCCRCCCYCSFVWSRRVGAGKRTWARKSTPCHVPASPW